MQCSLFLGVSGQRRFMHLLQYSQNCEAFYYCHSGCQCQPFSVLGNEGYSCFTVMTSWVLKTSLSQATVIDRSIAQFGIDFPKTRWPILQQENLEMEFLRFDPKSKELTLKKGAIPEPKPDDVLVKVAYAGICGTDLHILEGSFPCKEDGPFTLGHEFSGTVAAVGADVTNFKVGQRVVVDPNSGCNTCDFCHGGNYHFCQRGGIHNTIGIFKDGGWATHALVPKTQVYLVPDGVELPQAALAEPLSCMAHGLDRINPVHVGTRVLILGAGIIGSLWSSLLHLHGMRKTVTVSEPQPKRRELVKNLNLDYEAVSPSELKGREFDLVVDCSGSGPAMEAAFPLLGRGGRLCVFGVASPEAKMTISPFQVYMKELTVLGVNINPFTFPKALSLVQAMADRYLQYNKLGVGIYKLSQYHEALEALKKGEISKAVFKM